MVHSFISEAEALKHCDREKGCDHVFGAIASFFERSSGEEFVGSYSGGRLMDASDLMKKEKHARGGNFTFGRRRFVVRLGGEGGPGGGTFGITVNYLGAARNTLTWNISIDCVPSDSHAPMGRYYPQP